MVVSVGPSQVKLQKSVATNSEVIKTLAPGEAVQATEDGIDGLER